MALSIASRLRQLDDRAVAIRETPISARVRTRILLAGLCLLALVTSVPTAVRSGGWWRPIVALAIAAAGTLLYERTAGLDKD